MLIFVLVSVVSGVLSSFAIILTRKRGIVASLLLSFGCHATLYVLWLFLTLPWVGLQCWIMEFLIILTYLFTATQFYKYLSHFPSHSQIS